ncbi:hypothetical protein ACFSC6_06275 [Rufibacter sediminis]|uniref:Lipoprotein n=1 Tax=Rufibacter sediminis TaxID=2762756 RepID=A0ABR6VN81_9BACT|nr:hypothetical protein [Rufibacter sediminis]MBC3538617.1 hypothetical protein [Rufibacter sediminis]
MKRIYLLAVGILLLNSCSEKRDGEEKTGLLSHLVSITDNENKGVEEVLDFYGGQCKYAVGASASTDEGKKKYFELEVSQSEGIDKLADSPHLPGSNIPYLFFRNLGKEAENYDEIHTVLVYKDGQKSTYKYSTETLRLVTERMKVAEKIVWLIKEKDYDALMPMLNDSALFKYDKKALIASLKEADGKLGNVTEPLRPFGFKVNQTKDGKEILHIYGAMIRDKQNNGFGLDLDLKGKKEEAYLLNYEL